jgi:hypothetical protein
VQVGDLDGKSLFCTDLDNKTHPVYGLVFEQGKVTRWQVDGFSKKKPYEGNTYYARGTRYIRWHRGNLIINFDRHTLKVDGDQCLITTPTEIFQKLDEIIATAKKKNKL